MIKVEEREGEADILNGACSLLVACFTQEFRSFFSPDVAQFGGTGINETRGL